MKYFLVTFCYDVEGPFGDVQEFDDEQQVLDASVKFKAGEDAGQERGFMIICGEMLLDQR